MRRRTLVQPNRRELRHKLGRRVHHGERGEVRTLLRHGQEERLGALGLALDAIVHRNAIPMHEAFRHLADDGPAPRPADVARLSPIPWRHIDFPGRCDFPPPDAVAEGGPRPSRLPDPEWDS